MTPEIEGSPVPGSNRDGAATPNQTMTARSDSTLDDPDTAEYVAALTEAQG